MTDYTVALVRQAIFHVLDSASPRTPGLATAPPTCSGWSCRAAHFR